MKRILSFLLAFAMLFTLGACQNSPSATVDNENSSNPSSTVSDTVSDSAPSSSETATSSSSSSNNTTSSNATSSNNTSSGDTTSNNTSSVNTSLIPSLPAFPGKGADYVDGGADVQKSLFGDLNGKKLRIAESLEITTLGMDFYKQLEETTGMSIERQRMDSGELHKLIAKAVASGSKENAFDVATLNSGILLNMIYQGILMPMDQYIAKDDPVWKYTENADILAPEFFEVGGYTWGVPTQIYQETYIFYNKTHFKEMNAPDPYTEYYLKDNWTFETFLDTCKAVTKKKSDGSVEVAAFATWNYFSFLSAAGSDLIKMNDDRKWEITVNTPESISGLDVLYECAKNGWLDTNTSGSYEFVNRKIGMIIDTPYFAMRRTDAYMKMSNEIGLVPMPKSNTNQEHYVCPIYAQGYGIAGCAQNPAGAAAYIYYRRLAEQQLEKTESGKYMLSRSLDEEATKRRNEYISKCEFNVLIGDSLNDWFQINRTQFLNILFRKQIKPSNAIDRMIALIDDSLYKTVK